MHVWLGPAGYFCGCRRRITDADTHSNGNGHRDSNSYSNRYCDGNCNGNSHRDSHRYRNIDTSSHSDANACCEAHSAPASSSYDAAQTLIPE